MWSSIRIQDEKILKGEISMPLHLIIATSLVPLIIQKKSTIRLISAIILLIYFTTFAVIKFLKFF